MKVMLYGMSQRTITKEDIAILPFSEKDLDSYIQAEHEMFPALDSTNTDISGATKQVFEQSESTEYYSIFLRPDNTFCGKIELQLNRHLSAPGIGITILKQFQNQGIATLAIRKFCDYCLHDKGIHTLTVMIEKENDPSIRVFEKLGARYEGLKVPFSLEEHLRNMGVVLDPTILDAAKVHCYSLELPLLTPAVRDDSKSIVS